jgi:uncharacterized protein (UPF0212 family)
MSGICPHCKEELTYIREFQQAEVAYDVTVHDGEIYYEKQDDYDCCADWGCAECPECNEQIEGIKDESDAVAFLKGEMEVEK